MSSIRPLVTITILAVVGVYLYMKINEGPAPTHAGSAVSQSPDGVPPLSTAKGGASLAAESGAPAWPSTAATTAPPAASAVPAATKLNPPTAGLSGTSTNAKDNLPAVPAIPELPPLPAMSDVAPPSVAPPKDSPGSAPTARYPDLPGQSPPPAVADPGTTTTPTNSPQLSVAPVLTSPPTSPAQTPAANGGLQLTAPAAPPSQSAAQNPLRPAPGAEADRYGAAPAANTPAIGAPDASSFAASWPAIQAALDRRDLKQAHQLLSKWHGNETLSAADTEKVESLLSQLAGTVIYSTEHQLEPARIVKPGETLETISKEYNIPSQLLAKINGIQSPDQVRPGQSLKVVRGPFSATIDLSRSELTLMVDERYAGKFRVTVPPGAPLTDGQWLVDQKLAGPTNTANPSAYATTPIPADRSIILRNAAATVAGAPTLIIGSGAAPAGLAASPPNLRVSPQDAEEISDILSVGSRVVVRK